MGCSIGIQIARRGTAIRTSTITCLGMMVMVMTYELVVSATQPGVVARGAGQAELRKGHVCLCDVCVMST